MKQMIRAEKSHRVLSLIPDIAFSNVPAWFGATREDLKLNLIAPKNRTGEERFPLIIWICGGSYRLVDRAVWMPELLYFAERGYVVASVEYRTAPQAMFPAALEDVKSAIRYLKAHAADYCIDKGRVVIMGESAGGTLASLAAVTGYDRRFDVGEHLGENSVVHAAVDFYGIVDMLHTPFAAAGHDVPEWLLHDFLGNDYTEQDARSASAISYIGKDTPPFLILHGSADRAVPINQSERFYDALHKNEIRSDFYVLEGAGHGEDCFYTDEIKERILLFLNEVLKNEKI